MKPTYGIVKVADIKPAAYNPRDITAAAFEGLRESIRKFGFIDPVIINNTSGVLVGGHQRVKAASAEGLEEIPAIFVELDEVDEKALNVTLNNALISGHYTETLKDVLGELKLKLDKDQFSNLRFDGLVIEDSWEKESDLSSIKSNLDGITSTIKIRCPQEIESEFKEWLESIIQEGGYEGVEVV